MLVVQVLWDAVPRFMRKLDAILELTCKKKLPITAAPVKCVPLLSFSPHGSERPDEADAM